MLNDQLKALIDDVEVVSFDVFDTLLLRRHYSPTDVFAHAGESSPRRFRFMRVAVERIARLRHRHQQDVSLEQIYAMLRHTPERELLAERKTLFANAAVRPIYDYAVAGGKTVIAISDMYLPGTIIREVIENAGYTGVEKVYVSCDVGLTKYGAGDLYRHVAKDLGVAPDRILHVGDNEHSDVTLARQQGVRAWHLPSPRNRFESARSVHPQIIEYLSERRQTAHSLLLGILRDGLADPGPEHDYWYRLGFSVAGPIVNAFVDWVQGRFQDGGHDELFLFARDGYLPQQVLALRYPRVPAHYTFASRRLFLVAALQKLDSSTLSALRASLPGTTAKEHWTRLGISNASVEALLSTRFAPDEAIWSSAQRERLADFFREAHPLMLPDIVYENRVLRNYLSSIGLLGSAARPLIVDIGWRATSQRFLEQAIPELAGTSGAYFGLSDDAYRNGKMHGWFFDGFRPFRTRLIATACVEILELMFSAPHPSIQKIDALADGTFAPVHELLTPEEERRIAIVSRMQKGALDFTRRLHAHESAGFSIPISRGDAARFIRAIVLQPTAADIEHLGALAHPVGLGTSRYETLLPKQLPSHPFALLAQNLGKAPTRIHWPGGLSRAIALKHGSVRGFASRVVLAGAKFLLAGRERLTRLLGK